MRWLKLSLIAPIKAYQYLLSPWLGQWCRFTPSCSNYAIEAIQIRGPVVGLLLALRRVSRCHPWCKGGHDPVPNSPHQHTETQRTNSATQLRNPPD